MKNSINARITRILEYKSSLNVYHTSFFVRGCSFSPAACRCFSFSYRPNKRVFKTKQKKTDMNISHSSNCDGCFWASIVCDVRAHKSFYTHTYSLFVGDFKSNCCSFCSDNSTPFTWAALTISFLGSEWVRVRVGS